MLVWSALRPWLGRSLGQQVLVSAVCSVCCVRSGAARGGRFSVPSGLVVLGALVALAETKALPP